MSSNLIQMIWDSFLETIIMVAISGGIGALAGIPLGILLFVTDRKSFLPMPGFNAVLGTVINALRSVPFIILLVAIIPFTRLIVGSSIGTAAAIVPLTLSVAPFIARIVETSLREVDKGLVEAAQSMGATNMQIITKVLLPEAMPGIVAGLTISIISLIGYSAMAGAVGGGGLGDLGIRYGYQRFMPEVMWTVVIVLIILVQGIQSFGDWIVRRISHKYAQQDTAEGALLESGALFFNPSCSISLKPGGTSGVFRMPVCGNQHTFNLPDGPLHPRA